MTHTKRILCIMFALALGLALLSPGVSAADANEPIITKQPNLPRYIRSRRTLTLEIQAKAPDGTQGELSVAWFVEGQTEPFASGAKTSISTSSLGGYTNLGRFVPGGSFNIYAMVTNTYTDRDGQVQTASAASSISAVDIFTSPFDVIKLFWNANWAGGFFSGLLTIPLNIFVALQIMVAASIEYYLALILS